MKEAERQDRILAELETLRLAAELQQDKRMILTCIEAMLILSTAWSTSMVAHRRAKSGSLLWSEK